MRQPLILRVAAVLLVVLAGIAPAAALDDLAADPVGIEEMTYDLCTFERALGSKERTAAATYIATAMEERGLSVSTGRFSYSNCYFDPPLALSSNIIGVREGSTDRIVVISAHYDTAIPETPGADDNAAGVATMLEAARILNDTPLNHTVYFIAFGGEETGLEGSTRWLADNPDLHNRIIAAINLDCVASGDRLLATALPQHRWILDLLPSCIEETPERLLDAARGDEHAFRAAGIPALRLYERDSYAIIHTPDDQPERLNYTLAAECAAIVAGTIVGIDAADDAPEIDLLVENGTVTFRTPADAPVEVIVEWGDESELQIPITDHPAANLRRLPRDLTGAQVVAALDGRDWSGWYAWVASERSTVKAVKAALREQHGFPKADLKAQAYWIHGKSMGTSRGGSVQAAAKASKAETVVTDPAPAAPAPACCAWPRSSRWSSRWPVWCRSCCWPRWVGACSTGSRSTTSGRSPGPP